MRARLAGGVAAVLLLGTTLPAGASRAVAAPLPVLRGTVTLSGSTSFVREFVLTKPARLTAQHRTVRASGGRYAGFALRKVGSGMTPTWAAMRPGYCTTPGCSRPSWSGTYVMDLFTGYPLAPGDHPNYIPLTPGRYRIHLVADGKPVTVSLRFPGSGRTTFTSGRAARTPIAVPRASHYEPDTANGNTGHLYAAGATHRSRSTDVFHYMTSWKYLYGPPKSVNQEGVCVYEGKPTPGTFAEYQYPCSSGGAAGFFLFGQQPTDRKSGPAGAFDEYAATLQFFGVNQFDGERSIGGYINSHSPATGAHTTVLWVDL